MTTTLLSAEKNLLLGVRNRLRTGVPYTNAQCQIEPDDDAPAIVGDVYCIVGAQGYRPGPRNATGGQVSDLVFSVGIFVAMRITAVARDRREQTFVEGTRTLNKELEKVAELLNWNWTLVSEVNTLLTAETGTAGFMHPLVFESIDPKPRILGGEFFGSDYEGAAGMGRLMRFGGARRITLVP